jgi:MFS family permease
MTGPEAVSPRPKPAALEPAPARAGVVLPVVLCLAVQALMSMNVVAIAVIMPVASGDIGLPATFVGIAMSLVYLGATLGTPLSGHAIMRWGPIGISQICLLLGACGLAAFSIPAAAATVLGALLMGLGYGPITPASSHILIRTTPPSILSVVFSIKQTGVPLGGALAGAIIPWLVIGWGWQCAALVAGGSSVVLMAVLQPYRRHYDRERSRSPHLTWSGVMAPLKMTIAHPELRRIAIASTFYSIMQLCLVSFLVTYLIQDLQMSLVDAGLLLSAAQVCGVVGRILWGALSDRSGRPMPVLGALGLAMGGAALLAAAFTPAWSYAALLVVCGCFGGSAVGWNGVYIAEVARIATPAQAGAATGGSLFFTFLGILLGLPAFAWVVDRTGSYPAAFVMVAATTCACGVWLCFTGARDRPPL